MRTKHFSATKSLGSSLKFSLQKKVYLEQLAFFVGHQIIECPSKFCPHLSGTAYNNKKNRKFLCKLEKTFLLGKNLSRQNFWGEILCGRKKL